ncbi:YopX protein [compost metagenome]
MREIKFRGKQLDNGEWVHGDIWQHNGKVDIVYKSEGYPVDPETVGQYTGKNDVEGNELYDGDITIDEFGRKSLIYWDDKLARFVFQEHKKKTKYYLAIEHLKVMKIGNRWDNPELLGG